MCDAEIIFCKLFLKKRYPSPAVDAIGRNFKASAAFFLYLQGNGTPTNHGGFSKKHQNMLEVGERIGNARGSYKSSTRMKIFLSLAAAGRSCPNQVLLTHLTRNKPSKTGGGRAAPSAPYARGDVSPG
jgi:hypothetical protein